MFNRWIEGDLLDTLDAEGIGCIVFVPLAQGMLTDKYIDGIPDDSRAAKPYGGLRPEQLTDVRLAKVRRLNTLAKERGQSLAQMALAWILRQPAITSALTGASRVAHIEDNVAALKGLDFADDELALIEEILSD